MSRLERGAALGDKVERAGRPRRECDIRNGLSGLPHAELESVGVAQEGGGGGGVELGQVELRDELL